MTAWGYDNLVNFANFDIQQEPHDCANFFFGSFESFLDADSSSGFCRAITTGSGCWAAAYQLHVELWNDDSDSGINSGSLGVMYNVQDEDNYDFVYFRIATAVGCYQTGHVVAGVRTDVTSDICPSGPPAGQEWFSVTMEVSDSTASIKLNGELVVLASTNFPTTRRAGVLVANGDNNVIAYRKFQMI